MAAKLFLLPYRPALDTNAVPVSGAQLFFYVTGTSTPLPVFADEALAVSLGAIVQANSAGVWPSIYLDTLKTYRVVLRDEAGEILDEADPYIPGVVDALAPQIAINAAAAIQAASVAEAFVGPTFTSVAAGLAGTQPGQSFAVVLNGVVTVYKNVNGAAVYERDSVTTAALASTSGTGLIGYLPQGAGGVAMTLQQILDDAPENPLKRGAAIDGVTNDSPALQFSIDYVQSLGGGTIILPPGQMFLQNKVTISGNGVFIQGSGQGATIIVNGSAGEPAIQFGDGINLGYRNGMGDVIFGGAAGITPVAGNCGLLAIKQSNITLYNVQTFQFPGKLYDGIILDQVTQSYLDRLGLQDAVNRNLAITNQCVDVTATNGRCDAGAIGVEFRDVQGMHFVNFTCFGNTQYGWNAVTDFPQVGMANRYFYFTNCVGDSSGLHNWNIRQLSASFFTACWGSYQRQPVADLTSEGFHLDGLDVETLTFNGCGAFSNSGHGLAIWRGRSIHLSGCMFGSNFAPEDFGGVGSNNGKGGAGSGLYIGAEANIVTATGGHYENNTSYGVDIAAGAQNVTINGVDLRFNAIRQVRNLANASASQVKIVNCGGYNPVGFLAAPAVPGNDVEIVNLFDVDCMVYIDGGTVSSVRLDATGVYTGPGITLTPPLSVLVPVGGKIAMTYTVPPTWQWRGN